MEKEILQKFLGKKVSLLVATDDRELFRVGTVQNVTDECVLILFHSALQAYALSCILNVKELIE